MQTRGEFHELKSNWFMHYDNEVSTSPIRSSSFCPNDYHIIKGTKHQKDTLRSLTKFDQDIFKGKKENKNEPGQKANGC